MLSYEEGRQSLRDAQGQRVVDVLSALGFEPDFSEHVLTTYTGNEAQVPMHRYEDDGLVVRIGLSINPPDRKWPFDWKGICTMSDNAEPKSELGNHDASPRELKRSLVGLMAAARWGVPLSRIPNYTPEYQEWEDRVESVIAECGGLAVATHKTAL